MNQTGHETIWQENPMRFRQLLIVHSSKVAISAVKQYVLSEIGDIAFTVTTSGQEALEYLEKNPFDIVIADTDLVDINGIEIYEKIKASNLADNTEFILLAPRDMFTTDFIEKIQNAGIENYLAQPFSRDKIINKINTVCDPRSWRKNDRFHIPGARATLHLNLEKIDIKLINISLGGILCEFFYNYQPIELLGVNEISLNIPSPGGPFNIEQVSCKLSRMNVINWKSDDMAETLTVTWLFTDPTPQNKERLSHVIEMARELDLEFQEKA